MPVAKPFALDRRHWAAAFLVAAVGHAALFLVYAPHSGTRPQGDERQGIVIALRKFTLPPQAAPAMPDPAADPPVEIKSGPPPEPVAEPHPKPNTAPPPPPEPGTVVKQLSTVEQREAPVSVPQPPVPPPPTGQMAERASSEPIVDPGIQRDYEARLLAWLAGHKRYPGSARRSGHEGTIMLRFVIDADGRLRSYELLERSVYAGLNSAVERMVESAAPMPPVPAELRRGRAEFSFTVPVEFVIHP